MHATSRITSLTSSWLPAAGATSYAPTLPHARARAAAAREPPPRQPPYLGHQVLAGAPQAVEYARRVKKVQRRQPGGGGVAMCTVRQGFYGGRSCGAQAGDLLRCVRAPPPRTAPRSGRTAGPGWTSCTRHPCWPWSCLGGGMGEEGVDCMSKGPAANTDSLRLARSNAAAVCCLECAGKPPSSPCARAHSTCQTWPPRAAAGCARGRTGQPARGPGMRRGGAGVAHGTVELRAAATLMRDASAPNNASACPLGDPAPGCRARRR